jgi:2,4-dienoyl-CoA reductase-like NADH-dependent reductase (Old Yellow Enzyme family)/thioredoxin reductase
LKERKMLDTLKSPILIRNLKVRNRVVMPPMATRFASETGAVTKQLIDYHVERAKGDVGLQIVENVSIQEQAPPYILRIHSDAVIPGFNELAESIKGWGASAGIQLNPMGLQKPTMNVDQITSEEIGSLIEDFALAAFRGKRAGFDLVEIHGAHGYLIAQFTSPRSNHRNDEWGGTWERRANFLLSLIRRTREKVGRDFPLSLRISGEEFIEGGRTIEETERMVPLFERAGIDLLHVSAGGPETREWTGLPMALPRGALVHLAERLKKCVSIPVATVGRINDPLLADRIIHEGKADLVAFGRALLADPHLIQKAFRGKFEDLRKCTACMDCRMRVVDLGLKIKCSVNADLGREGESALVPPGKPKKVMVIGGGPAGMEAARIAKLRGHRVSLYDRENKLGGQLNLAIAPPHKEELKNILEYLSNQMKALRIPLRLGVRVDSGLIQKNKAEVVIVATGSKPALPSFGGNPPARLLTADKILGKKLPPGESFLILGGGSIGCEVAEYLAAKGKKVFIVEILDQIASDAESNARKLLVRRLEEEKVTTYTRSQVQKFEGNKATVVDEKGGVWELQADVVVAAVGAWPNPLSFKGIEKMKPAPEIYSIGDCRQPGKIMQAIHDGNRIGRII